MWAGRALSFGFLLAFFIFSCNTTAFSQTNGKYSLNINTEVAGAGGSLKLRATYPDSLSVLRAVERAVSEAQFRGYLLAAVQSLAWNGKHLSASLKLGEQYKLISLANGNIDPGVLQQSGYRERLFSNVPFSSRQLETVLKNVLKVFEDNGYPFASVWMDSIRITDGQISAKLYADKNRRFVFDTLVIAGNVKISRLFFQSYLDIAQGSAYSEANVGRLEKRINEFPFAGSVKSPEVAFVGDMARVTIFLKKKNANQFDGILGFLPNSRNGKLQVTGDINLRLQNAFKRAETISFNFKGLPQQSRQLNLSLSVPGLFSGPLGLGFALGLYKQDTSFQNVDFNASVSYRLGANRSIRFLLDKRTGNLVSQRGSTVGTSLPAFADVSTALYGLGIDVEKLDYRFNPTRGYKVVADASVGEKTIRKNQSVNPDLYGDVSVKSAQYRVQSRADVFIPLGKISTLNLANQTGLLVGKDFFENELFRLGGVNSLKGFNEQSILANAYTYFNAEYRYLLERNSFLFAFINQAYTRKQTVLGRSADSPLGFGTGINFETKAGMVSLSYALGKQRNNPVNLQSGKIHFGIIAIF